MHTVGTSHASWADPPQRHFADLDAGLVAQALAAAADLALVVDGQGVIRNLSCGASTQELTELQRWVGLPWLDTVTVESRVKVSELLAAAQAGTATRQDRQVNHRLLGGQELPVSYHVVPLGHGGLVLALGRNLSALAAVQQRLVDAQQSMERDYLRLRHTEARYRLLFEAVDEPLLVVDASSLNIQEHNGAATRLLGEAPRRIMGRPVLDFLAVSCQAVARALLNQARSAGQAEADDIRLAGNDAGFRLVVSLFRQDSASLLLLRLVPPLDAAHALRQAEPAGPRLTDVVEAMPDAFVLTDLQGSILQANRAFAQMLQLPVGEVLVGQGLERWLGRSSVDLSVLISNLRQHGTLRLFPTTLRAAYGEPSQVEITAVALTDAQPPCLGFSIRDVSRRLPADGRSQRQLPRTADQLTGLVGRLPLKEIVGETADLIERLCIEAALDLTRDNRASAAEMLGLSRQSLYVKLRRYGMQGAGAEDGVDEPSA